MNFVCTCCKQRVEKKNHPKWIIGAGIHDIAYHMPWVEFNENEMDLPIDKRKWFISDVPPEVGNKRILRVQIPFDEESGGIFTNIFETAQMYLNGWEFADHPEDIYKASAVLCRLDEVIWSDDFSAFINVEILNVVPFSQLYKVIPETVTDYKIDDFGKDEEIQTEYEDEHLLYRYWSAQGDVGQVQLVYTEDNGKRHEVMNSWQSWHEDFYYLVNIVDK